MRLTHFSTVLDLAFYGAGVISLHEMKMEMKLVSWDFIQAIFQRQKEACPLDCSDLEVPPSVLITVPLTHCYFSKHCEIFLELS